MPEREPDAVEQELEATAGFRASVSLLRRNRDFRRLFLASVISLGGDWFLFVAITSLIVQTTGRAIDVGLAILAQELAFFIASPPAGVLVDRLDRRKLMIVCDLARIGVCLSFLLVGAGTIWLAYPLLALLSVFGAAFDPASTAATPNLVDPRDLPTANALNGSLWGTMLAVGAGLGGIVATVFGRDTAFVIDAVSFGVSALLLWGIRRPFSEEREPGHEHPRMLDATIEVLQYARRDHDVLALIGVKAGFGLAAGVLALIPVFGVDVFDRGEIGVGALMAARGVGALVGPFLGHRLSGEGHRRAVRRDRRRARGVRPLLHGARTRADALGRGDRDLRRPPGRGGAVGALDVRAAGARARPHPRARLRLRLRDDHAVARDLELGGRRGGRRLRGPPHRRVDRRRDGRRLVDRVELADQGRSGAGRPTEGFSRPIPTAD